MKRISDCSWAVHDIETTGLTPDDRIVQIGLVAYSGDTEVFSRETLLNPQIPIPPQLTELHGISDEKVADASVLADVVDEWTGLLSNREFAVTYNGRRFDDGFIAHEWQRVGKTYSPVPMIDVCDYLLYYARKSADGKGNKLGDWCERVGIELVNAHSAVADCRATGRLFLWGMSMGIIPRTVEWALKIAVKIAEFHDLERELYDRVLYVDRRPDVDPIVRIAFGKHAGQSINAAPKSYLQWCLLNTDFPESVKLLFRQRIGGIEVQADGRLVAMREEITAMYAEASAAEKSSKARVICPTCLAAYEVLSDTAEPRNRMCPACTTRLKSDGNLCNLCMNRVDYRRDSFIGTPPEVLRNKLPVLHCSAEELADVKECQHFRPVTPQEIANTAKAIGCATVWAATHGGNITSEEQVTILTFVLPELPTAEDVTDAGAAVIQVNEAAAMLAGALDGTKVLVPVESNGVVMFHNREVSTFCDRKVPIGELPYAHVPPKLAEAMGVFIREFFAKGIAKYVVQRGVVGYPWVVLDLAIDLPIGILRMIARCLSAMITDEAEQIEEAWAAFQPYAGVTVMSNDGKQAASFGPQEHPSLVAPNGMWTNLKAFTSTEIFPMIDETMVLPGTELKPIEESRRVVMVEPKADEKPVVWKLTARDGSNGIGFCLARSEEQALSLIPMNLLAIEMSKEEAEGITFGGLAGTKTLWSVAELAARESDWKAGYGVIIFDANGLRQFSADEPLAH